MTLSMQVLQAALVLLLLYIPLSAYFNHRKLRQFPGPALAGYSRLWIFYQSLRARFAKAEIEALRTYGSPCRVGPDLLVTDDPDVVRHLSAAGSKWTRSGWYEGVRLDPRHESVFSTRDEGLHAELKAKESGAVRDFVSLCTCRGDEARYPPGILMRLEPRLMLLPRHSTQVATSRPSNPTSTPGPQTS